MKYVDFIQNILDTRGRFQCGDTYHERHHITPKCMGGTNEETNLIDLFAEEHYIAHKLLAEENADNDKLQMAWWCMCHIKTEDRCYQISAEEYAEARRRFCESMADKFQAMAKEYYSDPAHRAEAGERMSKRLEDADYYAYTCEVLENARNKRWSDERQHLEQSERTRLLNQDPEFAKENAKRSSERMKQMHKNKEFQQKLNEASSKRLSEKHNDADFEAKRLAASIKSTGKPVVQIDMNGNIIQTYNNIGDAAKAVNCARSRISECCSGKHKTAKGFKWAFADSK